MVYISWLKHLSSKSCDCSFHLFRVSRPARTIISKCSSKYRTDSTCKLLRISACLDITTSWVPVAPWFQASWTSCSRALIRSDSEQCWRRIGVLWASGGLQVPTIFTTLGSDCNLGSDGHELHSFHDAWPSKGDSRLLVRPFKLDTVSCPT